MLLPGCRCQSASHRPPGHLFRARYSHSSVCLLPARLRRLLSNTPSARNGRVCRLLAGAVGMPGSPGAACQRCRCHGGRRRHCVFFQPSMPINNARCLSVLLFVAHSNHTKKPYCFQPVRCHISIRLLVWKHCPVNTMG